LGIRENKNESANRAVKILFLGQCLQTGYEGVDRYSTFPNLAAEILRRQFPTVRFRFDIKHLYHLIGLKAILKHRLMLSQPDIAVISLPAMFAATSWRVNVVYEIAPEVVDTARSFMQKIEAKVSRSSQVKAETLIDRVFAIRPPIALDQYERLIQEAVAYCKRTSSCRVILMGPGRFNEDTCENYVNHSPEVWSGVNHMVRRSGERLNVPVINAQEALGGHGGEVFKLRNHRFSLYGHEVVAREVASVLSAQVAAVGGTEGLRDHLQSKRGVEK
jgi:hypothetical protein